MFLDKRFNKKHNTLNLRLRRNCCSDDEPKKTKTIFKLGTISADDQETLELYEELVKSLNSEYKSAKKTRTELQELLAAEIDDSKAESLNLGSIFIYKMLDFFGFKETFAYTQRKHSRLDYQIYKAFYYLVTAGILDPDSIREDVVNEASYFIDYGIKLWDAYRALSYIFDLKDQISRQIVKVIMDSFADTSGLFYIDATNIYTFSDEDPEVIERDGKKMPGLRRYGKSKESRDAFPLIGVSAIMTHNGLPLLMLIHPGNRHDSQMLIPAIKKLTSIADLDRIILCGDSAYNSSTNNFYLAGSNKNNILFNGYVFSKALKANDRKLLEWINDPSGWFTLDGKPIPEKNMRVVIELLSLREDPELEDFPVEIQKLYNSFRYKEECIVRTDHVWNHDKTRKIPAETRLKQIVFFSPKLRKKKLATIERRINRARNIEENPDKTSDLVKNSTSEYAKLEMKDAEITLDEKKIQSDVAKAGYFLLETSERDLSAKSILHIYNDKKWIEWNFRIFKSELHLRPVFVFSMNHIEAVLLVRFTSLVIIKCLQFLLGYAYSTEKIIKSLKNFRCVPVGNSQYIVTGRNEVIKDLEQIFGIHFNRIMKKSEIKKTFSGDVQIFGSQNFCENCDLFSLDNMDKKDLEKRSRIKFKKMTKFS